MADISVHRNHELTLEEAQGKISEILSDIQEEFGGLVSSVDWNAEKTVAKVGGKGFKGVFKVDADSVGIDIDLKLFAKPLKGKVRQKIEERITKYFG